MQQISKRAIDLIVREEVSSEAYYKTHYQRPEWPGGQSGVTVGIGYDLGYQSASKIQRDWSGVVDEKSVSAMMECAGIKGSAASAKLGSVKSRIIVPWDAAMKVFMNRDVPEWTAATYKGLPNCDLIGPTCLGVLVSISYNRGAAGWTSTDRSDPNGRFREMRAIRNAMASKNFGAIADLIDAMARLWVGTSVAGVAARRHREAKMFREGLTEQPGLTTVVREPDPATTTSIRPDTPARTPAAPPATGKVITSGTIIAAGAGAAEKASAAGYHWGAVVGIAVVTLAIAAAVYIIWSINQEKHPATVAA